MGKYTIISDGKKINMFDRELGVDLSLRSYISSYYFSTIVNKVGIFITTDTRNLISGFETYFEKSSLAAFQGPIIFITISKCSDQLNDIANQVYWIESQDNIVNAVYNDDFFYLSDDISIKVNKGLHFVKIALTEACNFTEFIPYIIKVIEGLIIENHLKLGLFPIHSSLVECGTGECILIMGNSQSGKTTTADLLCENNIYRILSDDIVFIDGNGYAYPYGQYRKIMYDDDKDDIFLEKIMSGKNAIYRKVSKIANSYIPYRIRSIIIPQIMCIDNTECIRMSNEDIEDKINQLLNEYPNKWFLYSDFNDVLGYQIKCILNKIKTYKISMKYQSKNTEIARAWVNECII